MCLFYMWSFYNRQIAEKKVYAQTYMKMNIYTSCEPNGGAGCLKCLQSGFVPWLANNSGWQVLR